jgi:YVTN family beta-propeller protein
VWCIVLALLAALPACADLPAREMPTGPVAGKSGAWVLPSGRLITPAGRQTTLGNFPLGIAASPDGRTLFVVNNGAGPQSVQVIAAATGQVTQTVPERTVFYGIVVSPDGKHVWVAGGGAQAVLAFDFTDGRLLPAPSLPVFGYPTGLALAPDGKMLYVTCNLTRHIVVLDTVRRTEIGRITVGAFPFAIALSPDGRRAYVTNWGDGTVSVLDTQARKPLKVIPTGGLPSAVVVSPNGKRVYVANANTDSLTTLDATTFAHRTNPIVPYPHAPNGSVPNGLALSPDGKTLYVTLAGNNAVAAYATATLKRKSLTPTAWYPTGILCARDGKTLYVISSKGVGSGPNKNGGYIGHIIRGTLSTLSLNALSDEADVVARNNGYAARLKAAPAVGREGEHLPPIKHCVLIVRENRTYDQVLGDRNRGNGDSSLTLFGQKVTPNLHALVERFASADNFYSDGEVSAQGHQWTLGANCPDYVEKTWMAYYSARGRLEDSPYSPISYPAEGFNLDLCVRNGVSCRMYGDAVRIGEGGKPLPSIADKRDPQYRGWDLEYPDTRRVEEWLREFHQGIFPAFSYIWLPNDHTAAARLGYRTPRAMVADNDVATGQIIAAISHSKFWADTAIFLCEDDSQDGRDHVDAHRNILLIASPWVRPGSITSHHYSQVSIYTTIERLLHLPPMGQYDELADPIRNIWADTPDLRPYEVLAAQVSTEEKNTQHSSTLWRESARLDLEEADADKTGLLEEILWRMEKAHRTEGHR